MVGRSDRKLGDFLVLWNQGKLRGSSKNSGCQFLWSLRKKGSDGFSDIDYDDFEQEVGMAEMITLDHAVDFRGERPPEIVGADRIEAAIRRLMAAVGGSGVREKVNEMQKNARGALSLFIEDVIRNLS
ncbi:hypothetical protein C2S52_012168 [Perilla frutescens var. hirtella]|nr:hypothetical protein C2S52_012168 [Perilla frutescens var. hirtella]KAH6785251.1 hypothetical protein C2S51_037706 [Perilla frutescens var. frutescens]